MNKRINAVVAGTVAGLAGVGKVGAQFIDTASAGNGGVATASANGGAVSVGNINSGGNVWQRHRHRRYLCGDPVDLRRRCAEHDRTRHFGQRRHGHR